VSAVNEDLINRAALLLAFMGKREARGELELAGVEPALAYLAVEAGHLLNQLPPGEEPCDTTHTSAPKSA
jgi:hypothetical protein